MASFHNKPTTVLSLVVPMHNEEEAVDVFLRTVVPIVEDITPHYEIVCVNDGSRDRTLDLLRRAHALNRRIKIIDFSRNFGKEAAVTAGIDHSCGEAVIPLDADMQDPPALIKDMVAKWQEGYDVVLAQRTDRSSDSPSKRLSARLFYKLIDRMSDVPIPENVGDFRLMDRRVVKALAHLPERTRFMKGIFAWLGFRQTVVQFVRPSRISGDTKWRFWSLWNFALDGIVSFTTFPLRIWSYIGFLCALCAMGYMGYIVLRTVVFGVDVPGYASLLSVVLFFNGLIMISLGVIGEYLGRVFIEVKGRPHYLVQHTMGFDDDDDATEPRKPEKRVKLASSVGPDLHG